MRTARLVLLAAVAVATASLAVDRGLAAADRSAGRGDRALVGVPEDQHLEGRDVAPDQGGRDSGDGPGRGGHAGRPAPPRAPAARGRAAGPRGLEIPRQAARGRAQQRRGVRGRVGAHGQGPGEGARRAVAGGARRRDARGGARGRRGLAPGGARLLRRQPGVRAQHDARGRPLLPGRGAGAAGPRGLLPDAVRAVEPAAAPRAKPRGASSTPSKASFCRRTGRRPRSTSTASSSRPARP